MRRWRWDLGPVAASGQWISPVVDLADSPGLAALVLVMYSAVASNVQRISVEWSDDGTTWRVCPSRTLWDRAQAPTDMDTFAQTTALRTGRLHRVRYENGVTAQSNVTLLLIGFDDI
jgi:hypothetical protein